MKDTLRVLISWDCNLNCSYCCNKIPEVRQNVTPTFLNDISFSNYKVICISGGEPLLYPERVKQVCRRATGQMIVLYTNGTLMTPENGREIALALSHSGIKAMNVGLHEPSRFAEIIENVERTTENLAISVRYQVEDVYSDLTERFPDVHLKFWHRNDCFRDNEDHVVLLDFEGEKGRRLQ